MDIINVRWPIQLKILAQFSLQLKRDQAPKSTFSYSSTIYTFKGDSLTQEKKEGASSTKYRWPLRI